MEVNIRLYRADCREFPHFGNVDAVVTDPPYGSNNDCDYTRFTGGRAKKNKFPPVLGDDEPFDPTPWLDYPEVILWGYQYHADKLPLGTVLVWLKKRMSKLGKILSDCELAWQKGGHGVYLFRHIWDGFDRETERGEKTLCPTQKPIALMEWCIERVSEPGDTILDPYMGTGPVGIACVRLKRSYVGIELSPYYFEIARRRIGAEQAKMEMFL